MNKNNITNQKLTSRLSILFCCFNTMLWAAEIGSITNCSWQDQSTWSSGQLPGSLDDVTIPAGFLMASDSSFVTAKQVDVKVHDPDMLWADCTYRALSATEDGKLFMGFTTHWMDLNAAVLSYDPATQTFAQPFDLGNVTSVETGPDGELSQGKIHTPLFENDKVIYFGTGYGPSDFKTHKQRKPYSGGCFVAFDQKSGEARVLGRTPKMEGVMTLEPDFPRNALYGITVPSGLLLRCDIATGEVENLGAIDDQFIESNYMADYIDVVRCLVIHPDTGVVYGSRKNGVIWQYDPATGKISETGLNTKQGIVGETDNKALISSQWRMAVLSPDKNKIYATHQGTTSLFEFNFKSQTITPMVRLCTDADLNSKGNLRGSRLAFLLADGKIHHLAHGPAVTVKERELNPAYQAHYITYDLATKKRTDHGPLMAPGERRVCHADTLAILPDGRLFSLAWVETVDPARIEAMKSIAQGRPLYSKMRNNGPYYEVQLVELIKK